MIGSGRMHAEVLHQPRAVGVVWPTAVRQRFVPDNQIAGFACYRHCPQRLQIFFARIDIGWQTVQPIIYAPVKSRYAGESSLLLVGIGQIDQA